jgi:hypothetical protein
LDLKRAFETIDRFADNFLLSIAGNNVADYIQKMNEDLLESLSKCLRLNQLKLKVKNTKYMIIRGSRLNANKHRRNKKIEIWLFSLALHDAKNQIKIFYSFEFFPKSSVLNDGARVSFKNNEIF